MAQFTPLTREQFEEALSIILTATGGRYDALRDPAAREEVARLLAPQLESAGALGAACRQELGIAGSPTAADVERLREILGERVIIHPNPSPYAWGVIMRDGRALLRLPEAPDAEKAAGPLLWGLGFALVSLAAPWPARDQNTAASSFVLEILADYISRAFRAGWLGAAIPDEE